MATCANTEFDAGDLYAGGGDDERSSSFTTRKVRRGGVRGLLPAPFAMGVRIIGLVLVFGVVASGDWDWSVEDTWLESDGACEVSSK